MNSLHTELISYICQLCIGQVDDFYASLRSWLRLRAISKTFYNIATSLDIEKPLLEVVNNRNCASFPITELSQVVKQKHLPVLYYDCYWDPYDFNIKRWEFAGVVPTIGAGSVKKVLDYIYNLPIIRCKVSISIRICMMSVVPSGIDSIGAGSTLLFTKSRWDGDDTRMFCQVESYEESKYIIVILDEE